MQSMMGSFSKSSSSLFDTIFIIIIIIIIIVNKIIIVLFVSIDSIQQESEYRIAAVRVLSVYECENQFHAIYNQ